MCYITSSVLVFETMVWSTDCNPTKEFEGLGVEWIDILPWLLCHHTFIVSTTFPNHIMGQASMTSYWRSILERRSNKFEMCKRVSNLSEFLRGGEKPGVRGVNVLSISNKVIRGLGEQGKVDSKIRRVWSVSPWYTSVRQNTTVDTLRIPEVLLFVYQLQPLSSRWSGVQGY